MWQAVAPNKGQWPTSLPGPVASLAVVLAACSTVPDPACPRAGAEVSAQLFGPVSASGRLTFGEGSVAADGGTLMPVKVKLQVPPPTGELTLVGLASCRGGVVRARLSGADGASEPQEPKVLSAALEALYRPELVSGELVGGFSVQLEDPNGSGYLDLEGFVGSPPPAAKPTGVDEAVAEHETAPGEGEHAEHEHTQPSAP